MDNFLFVKFNHRQKQLKPRIIVSLKVSKKAVVRNKIKRRIKHALKELVDFSTNDLVVITNKNIINKSYQEIKQALKQELIKKNILK